MRPVRAITVVCLFVMLVFSHFPGHAQPKTTVQTDTVNIIQTAQKYLKTPYRFGGEGPSGFDCSGFVKYVYGKHNYKLPRAADLQYKVGKKVERSQLRPGDLVFFSTYAPGASHVGIYYGSSKFIHASSSRGVMISRLDDAYWKPRYLSGRRIAK